MANNLPTIDDNYLHEERYIQLCTCGCDVYGNRTAV